MSIKNVALIGAAGNVGTAVLPNLLAQGFKVTILTREGSKSTYDPSLTVKTFTYESHPSLVSAFSGQDAVIAAVTSGPLEIQKSLIDAAIEAGVTRFIPSEFGVDTAHPNIPELGLLNSKIEVNKYLQQKAAEGKIEYTGFVTGPFFEWGLKIPFLGFNIAEKKAKIFDDGNTRFTTTNLTTIGKLVALSLTDAHLAESKNKALYLKSYVTTQNEILAAFEKATGSKWEVERAETGPQLLATGKDLFKEGNQLGYFYILQESIFDKDGRYGLLFPRDDTKGWVTDEPTLEETVISTLQ